MGKTLKKKEIQLEFDFMKKLRLQKKSKKSNAKV